MMGVRQNSVMFFLSADRKGRTEYMSARVVLPDGREFHVGYHPNIGEDGQRDGIGFGYSGRWVDGDFQDNTAEQWSAAYTWFEDRKPDDMFCSELFHALTGLYPYEVEEYIPANSDYCEFKTPPSSTA